MNTQQLKQKALTIRREVLTAITNVGSGHLGGSFSCVEILVYLYYKFLTINPSNLAHLHRDRFLMGKGHGNLVLYGIFKDLGLHPPVWWDQYCQDGAKYGGQMDTSLPEVEYNTGSLGHAMGIGCGLALAAKMNESTQKNVVLVGDAELQEGSCWEAMMLAGNHHLNNLLCIIDRNKFGVTQKIDDELEPLRQKFEAFHWSVDTVDGHDFDALHNCLTGSQNISKPRCVIANTIKGKGIHNFENVVTWHHGAPPKDQLPKLLQELEASI